MEIINIITLGFIALLCVLGMQKGFLEGMARLLGWIIALIFAIRFGPQVSDYLKDTFSISANIVNIIAAIIVFVAVIILINILVSLLQKIVKILRLGFADRILGFIFGGAKALIIIFILSFLIQWLPIGEKNKKIITDSEVINWSSRTVAKFLSTTKIDEQIKNNKFYKELLQKTSEFGDKLNKKASSNQ
ncbi:MAG: CvpA family protein [Candidatus Cloacimonetes bacterium]|nr:CvpA family protein [Candidatus Cloacimonadota bacterium]MBL7108086.1 CvpA family protein [Candidatus Cloacimonadota bacterium]